ncbi:unnamed protein product [Echinostoma caproni]|uniref:Tropomyosin n=1 Tax=Echinostoma caproni TaxID=27848 RepID=A0A183ARV3_9TREM|nr:unnamed protein product [Echinostoma caproni]
MEHIKKKMQAMKLDKENALDEADQLEAKLREKELEMQTKDEEMAEIAKRIQQLETDKETAQTQLTETNQKLDETEKRATEAETEVSALQKRIRQLEDELESTETRLTEATAKLEEASKAADESDRSRRTLENRQTLEDDRIVRLTDLVRNTTCAANEAKDKYEEAARKLTITEVELERAESRLEAAERYQAAQRATFSPPCSVVVVVVDDVAAAAVAVSVGLSVSVRIVSMRAFHVYHRPDMFCQWASSVCLLFHFLCHADFSAFTTDPHLIAPLFDPVRMLVYYSNIGPKRLLRGLSVRSTSDTVPCRVSYCIMFNCRWHACLFVQTGIIRMDSRMRELQSIIHDATGRLKSLEHQEFQAPVHILLTAIRTHLTLLISKITELEEELRIVGNNVKSLEISEQEAAQREEAYEENIRDLTERLKAAEDRAQESERLVNTLQADADRLEGNVDTPELRVSLVLAESRAKQACQLEAARQTDLCKLEEALDAERLNHINLRKEMENMMNESIVVPIISISDELVAEKEKYKALSEELDSTYAELTGN